MTAPTPAPRARLPRAADPDGRAETHREGAGGAGSPAVGIHGQHRTPHDPGERVPGQAAPLELDDDGGPDVVGERRERLTRGALADGGEPGPGRELAGAGGEGAREHSVSHAGPVDPGAR